MPHDGPPGRTIMVHDCKQYEFYVSEQNFGSGCTTVHVATGVVNGTRVHIAAPTGEDLAEEMLEAILEHANN